jgi:transcriptional regulator with XRE-family HTH domain
VDTLAKRFGKEVRVRRQACGWTQAQFAERIGMSEEWVRRIERGGGAPSFEALEAISGALGAPIADLFAGERVNPRQRRLQSLLAPLDDTDLAWVERLVATAMSHPAVKS